MRALTSASEKRASGVENVGAESKFARRENVLRRTEKRFVGTRNFILRPPRARFAHGLDMRKMRPALLGHWHIFCIICSYFAGVTLAHICYGKGMNSEKEIEEKGDGSSSSKQASRQATTPRAK